MGMRWATSLVVGFVVDREELEDPFKRKMPAETHLEDRYDARTGKKVGQVTVVDKEVREDFFFNEENLGDDANDLISTLEGEVDCVITLHGNFCDGDDMVYAIEPIRVKESEHSDAFTFKEIASLELDCDRIRQAFKARFDIDLGDPVVTTVMSYA